MPPPTRITKVNGQKPGRVTAPSPERLAKLEKRRAARSRLVSRPARQVGNFAMMQPQLARVNSVAAQKIGENKTEPGSRFDRSWQPQCYDFAASVGELGYVLNLTANAVAACDLVVKESVDADDPENPDAPPEVVVSEDVRARRVMDAFVGERGGQRELKWRFAYHTQVAGETYLVGTPQEEESLPLGITWEFLSTEEIHIGNDDKVTRRRDGTAVTTGTSNMDPETYLARSWKSDPRFSDRADSPVRRVAPILAELVVLTQMVDAVIKSRLSADMLFVPQEMSFEGQDDEEGDEDEETYGEDDIDPFTKRLMEHMAEPVRDRASAASLVPLVLRGKAEEGDKVRLVPLSRDMTSWAKDLRDEAIERLAAGLDIPPEVMAGKGGLNHWTGWNVDTDYVVKHVAPIGELLADFLTHAYLRPMLEEFEGLEPEEAARFSLEFDANPILSAADESNTARALYGLDAISKLALVRHSGFEEGDMPEPEEIVGKQALAMVLRNANLAPYLIHLIPGFENVTIDVGLGIRTATSQVTAPTEPTAPDGGDQTAPTGTGDMPDLTGPGSDAGPAGAPEAEGPGFTALVDRLAVAADSALERALERAGQKLINRSRSDTTLRDRLAAVDKIDSLTMVSAGELRRMRLSYQDLFGDAWDRYAPKARQWVQAWLERTGMEPLMAGDAAARAVNDLCHTLDTWLAPQVHRKLNANRNGLRVPTELVDTVMAAVAPVGAP